MHAQAHPNRIRPLREQRGLTREQLAVLCGRSSSTIHLAERAGILTRTTAERIAAALGVSVEELA
jgi:transcriptional regulator with XRE-family HTH domain